MQVSLSGLDDFAEKVKDFFKAAIEKQYPEEGKDADISPEQKGLQLKCVESLADRL